MHCDDAIPAEHHISGVYTKMLMEFLVETMPSDLIEDLLHRAVNFGLRKFDRLIGNALDWKDRLQLTSGRRRTEDHLRPQQQSGGGGFGVQDVQTWMTTIHANHHWENESRDRQTDVVGQFQHVLERRGPVARFEALERSGQTPTGAGYHCPARTEPEVGRREAFCIFGDRKSLSDQESHEGPVVKQEWPRGQRRGRRWRPDPRRTRRPPMLAAPRPSPPPCPPAGPVLHPRGR